MVKYDEKKIVNWYIDSLNKFKVNVRWLNDNTNLVGTANYQVHLCDCSIFNGKVIAYKNVIQTLFMVSEKNFDNFIKSVVMGDKQ